MTQATSSYIPQHRPTRHQRCPRLSHGFTLIELLVVLFLLGVVYALAGPMLEGSSGGVDMKAAARQLAAGLRKARVTALSEGRDAVMTIQLASRQFSVSGDPRSYQLPGKLDLSLFTAQSERIASDSGNIRFFADGSSTGGRITVSSGTHQQQVDVDWLTGRVKIY